MSRVQTQLDLRDIHLPPEPPLWPPAPGWWLLAVLLLAAGTAVALKAWRLWRRRRRCRQVLKALDRLAAQRQGPALVAAVAALLKRAALARFPRTEVASLTGGDWLAFLDRTGGDGRFQSGPGRVLADGLYAPVAADLDQGALLAAARVWLRRNAC